MEQYFNYRDELSVYSSLVVKGSHVIIDTELRQEILQCVQKAHQGISKTLERVKISVFWPGITQDIKDMIEKCDICQQHRVLNPPIPVHQQIEPGKPVQYVGIDLCQSQGCDILMITNYYSCYMWTCELYQDTKSCSIITALLTVFCEFGVSEYLLSDGTANFTSEEMETFCKQFAVQHITTSPYHPASNGKAESAVKFVKTIKKVYNSQEFSLTMKTYHNTLIGANLLTPAEYMFQRCICTDILSNIIEREENSANVQMSFSTINIDTW